MSDTPEVDAEAIRSEFEAALHQPNAAPPTFPLAPGSSVKRCIGVVSGKGGVGKSLVCSALSVELARSKQRVGVLDADITGPSIPKMLGLSGKRVQATAEERIIPAETALGTKVVSTNLMLSDERDPVLWRGPILAGVLSQFWGECDWGEIDCMLVDMPPGTGDVALTVFQSLPIDGIIVVTSPQDLVQMVVSKAVRMAEMMDVPILGLVENMAWVSCPHCGEHIEMYGKSHVAQTAAEHNLTVLASLGIDPAIAAACDAGTLEQELPEGLLDDALKAIGLN